MSIYLRALRNSAYIDNGLRHLCNNVRPVLQVMQWMDYMAKQYPKFAFTFEIGETIEGRSIKVLRVRFVLGFFELCSW